LLLESLHRLFNIPLDDATLATALKSSNLPCDGIETNEDRLIEEDRADTRVQEAIKIREQALERISQFYPSSPRTWIHGNPGEHNAFFVSPDRVVLINWESSRVEDPIWELALLFERLGPEERAKLQLEQRLTVDFTKFNSPTTSAWTRFQTYLVFLFAARVTQIAGGMRWHPQPWRQNPGREGGLQYYSAEMLQWWSALA